MVWYEGFIHQRNNANVCITYAAGGHEKICWKDISQRVHVAGHSVCAEASEIIRASEHDASAEVTTEHDVEAVSTTKDNSPAVSTTKEDAAAISTTHGTEVTARDAKYDSAGNAALTTSVPKPRAKSPAKSLPPLNMLFSDEFVDELVCTVLGKNI